MKLGTAIPDMLPELDEKECDLLARALSATMTQRQITAFVRRLKKSGLRVDQSLDGYEWGRFEMPRGLTRESMCNLDFIRNRQNLILYGTPGTGKTRLANGLGIVACQRKLKVRFENTSEFVAKLSEAYARNRSQDYLSEIYKLDLLILDEWGYVPVNPDGTRLLFNVIGNFYETKSLIITTNLTFAEWKQIFLDDKLTAAIADRMIQHSHLVYMVGQSYRVEHSLISLADGA